MKKRQRLRILLISNLKKCRIFTIRNSLSRCVRKHKHKHTHKHSYITFVILRIKRNSWLFFCAAVIHMYCMGHEWSSHQFNLFIQDKKCSAVGSKCSSTLCLCEWQKSSFSSVFSLMRLKCAHWNADAITTISMVLLCHTSWSSCSLSLFSLWSIKMKNAELWTTMENSSDTEKTSYTQLRV